MSIYILDTTVWIDLLRTNSQSIRGKLSAHSKDVVGLSVITACELQYGIELRATRHPHLRLRELQLLNAILAPFSIFPFTVDAIPSYGALRAALETNGKAIGALDMCIAAQALCLRATLVTSNRGEFQRIPNLRLEDWR